MAHEPSYRSCTGALRNVWVQLPFDQTSSYVRAGEYRECTEVNTNSHRHDARLLDQDSDLTPTQRRQGDVATGVFESAFRSGRLPRPTRTPQCSSHRTVYYEVRLLGRYLIITSQSSYRRTRPRWRQVFCIAKRCMSSRRRSSLTPHQTDSHQPAASVDNRDWQSIAVRVQDALVLHRNYAAQGKLSTARGTLTLPRRIRRPAEQDLQRFTWSLRCD